METVFLARTTCRRGFRKTEMAYGGKRKLIQITNKVPSFIVEKRRVSSGSANELRTWPKCNYLGRSAWIYLFSMLDECARRLLRKDKYSDMHNRKKRQRRARPRFVPTYFFLFTRDSTPVSSVRGTLISQNRVSSGTPNALAGMQLCECTPREREYERITQCSTVQRVTKCTN